MTTEIKIKEHDLHDIIKDLIDSALDVDRKNKAKICSFVVNLVENGGHKTKAARAAGFGAQRGKDGSLQTEEMRNNVASSEADRLLKNDKISSLYDTLLSHRYTAEIFTKSFSPEHVIHILYQIAMKTKDKNPGQAIKALKEASTLAGHYQIAEVASVVAQALKDEKVKKDNITEIQEGAPILNAILAIMRKNSSTETVDAANSVSTIEAVVSEVCN